MLAKTIDQKLPGIVSLLDSTNIDYWLARGVLRNLYITGEIGDKNSDLDFHIWESDRETVRKLLEPILTKLYSDLVIEDKDYKLAFYIPERNGKYDFFVEFMFLFKDEGNEFVYHRRRDGKRYSKAICFSHKRQHFIRHSKCLLRIPASTEDYLLGTYGPRWRENRQQDKFFKSTPELLNNLEEYIKNF